MHGTDILLAFQKRKIYLMHFLNIFFQTEGEFGKFHFLDQLLVLGGHHPRHRDRLGVAGQSRRQKGPNQIDSLRQGTKLAHIFMVLTRIDI